VFLLYTCVLGLCLTPFHDILITYKEGKKKKNPSGRGVYVATLKVKLRLTMVPCVAVKSKRVCEYEGSSRSLLLPISLRESRVSSSWWYTKLEWRLLLGLRNSCVGRFQHASRSGKASTKADPLKESNLSSTLLVHVLGFSQNGDMLVE
jgi:hypothetical protein